MDYLGYQAEHHHMYPFTYEPGCGMPLCRFDLGLDFALIPVDSLTRAGFAKNNNVPITRENWVHQPNLTFDFYRMLGIPEDCVFEPTPRNGNVTVQPVMMAIEKISYEEAKDIPHLKSDSWFFGSIHQEVTREVMKGMSGGPIYGFRRDAEGNLRYHVVALQSWWDKEQRVIFGCPILNFAETVYDLMGWQSD